MPQIVGRTRRRSKVQHVAYISRHLQRLAPVRLLELELFIIRQMAQVALSASNEIVNRQHFPPFGEQPVAKMRSQKTRPARHHCTHATSSEISVRQCNVSGREHPSVALPDAGIKFPISAFYIQVDYFRVPGIRAQSR